MAPKLFRLRSGMALPGLLLSVAMDDDDANPLSSSLLYLLSCSLSSDIVFPISNALAMLVRGGMRVPAVGFATTEE